VSLDDKNAGSTFGGQGHGPKRLPVSAAGQRYLNIEQGFLRVGPVRFVVCGL
jgi:hypothetical protein